jgi:hypothetical protein
VGIRETLNRKPSVAISATALVALAAIGFCIWYVLPSARQANLAHEYFTDDDGATWFTASNTDIPPFDHNGRLAVIAKVFRCRNGTAFVGYLAKFSPEAKKRMIQARASGHMQLGTSVEKQTGPDMLVKKPSGKEWVDVRSPQAAAVMKITCPDGGSDYEQLPPP